MNLDKARRLNELRDAMVDVLAPGRSMLRRDLAEAVRSAFVFFKRNFTRDGLYCLVREAVQIYGDTFYVDPATKRVSLTADRLEQYRRTAARRRPGGNTACGRVAECIEARDV